MHEYVSWYHYFANKGMILMCTEQVSKSEMTLGVIKEQISLCSNAIVSYNVQYYSSSVLCVIIAAAATALSITQPDNGLLNLFYFLPIVYLASLYNLVKYTDQELKIGAYKMVFEHLANECLDTDFLCWEVKIACGKSNVLFEGAVQVLFYLPVFFCLMLGFWKLNHNALWVFVFVFIVLQTVLIIVMSFFLIGTKKRTLGKMGYSIENGKLVKDKPQKPKN